MLLLLGGALANIPSCEYPTYDFFNASYNFIDNNNNSWRPVNDTAVSIPPSQVTATEKAILGAGGLSYIQGVRYAEADGDRGAAWLFYDAGRGTFYAVFQWSKADRTANEIYGIPNLIKTTDINETYYANDDEAVWFYNTTAVKIRKIQSHGDGSGTCNGGGVSVIKLGVGRFYSHSKCGTQNTCSVSSNSEGGDLDIHCTGAPLVSSVTVRAGNQSIYARMEKFGSFTSFDFNAYKDVEDLENDYYSCSGNSGDIFIYGFEGSEECGSVHDLGALDCEISKGGVSNTCNLTASTNRTLNATMDSPDYKYFNSRADGFYHFSGGAYKDWCEYHDNGEGEKILLYTQSSNTKLLHILPEHKDADALSFEFFDWLGEYIGITRFEIGERIFAGTMKYNSPVAISEMVLSDAVFLDELDSDGLCSETELWSFKGLIGYNSSHYLNYSARCDRGTFSDGSGYLTTTTAVINQLGDNSKGLMLSCNSLPTAPVSLNEAEGTIDRYFMYWYDIDTMIPTSTTRITQNSNFALNYSYLETTEGNCSISDLPYGNYSYSCDVPDGYYGNTIGFIDHNAPLTTLKLELQTNRDIFMRITVTDQGATKAGIKCIGRHGFDTTNALGQCTIKTAPNSDESIRLTQIQGRDDFVFNVTIGDVYNSEKLGDDGFSNTCNYFDGIYKFNYDLAYPNMAFKIGGKTTNENYIEFVSLFVDGDMAGTSGKNGFYNYLRPYDALTHTLTTKKGGWSNGTATFDYRNRDGFVFATMHPTDKDAIVEGELKEPITDFTGFEQVIFTPFGGGILILSVVVILTAVFTGMVAIAGLIGIFTAIALVFFGVLPIWFGVMIILVCGAIGYIAFQGIV